MEGPTDEWLARLNAEFGANDVPHRARGFLAWDRWQQQRRVSLPHNHPIAQRIYAWFAANTKPGSQALGPLCEGALFYDGEFWRLDLRPFFGTVKINGLDCIVAMPRSVKYRLSTDPSARSDFTRTFTNFLDVSDGPQHAKAATRYGSFAASLFGGAYQKLSTLPPLLTGSRPIAAVLDPAHLTVEMFLKGFLAVHDGLTEKTAIGEYRHDLPKLLERCQVLAPAVDFGVTIADLSVFPGMGARYGEMDCTPVEMWRAFSCALAGGASVTRALFGTQIVLGPDQLRSA